MLSTQYSLKVILYDCAVLSQINRNLIVNPDCFARRSEGPFVVTFGAHTNNISIMRMAVPVTMWSEKECKPAFEARTMDLRAHFSCSQFLPDHPPSSTLSPLQC